MTSRAAGRFDWERAVRVAALPMAPALVAFTLATYADADGTSVRPSQSSLASGLGLSRSTITRALRLLRSEGYVEQVREPGPGRTAEYRLTLPMGAPETPKVVTSDTEGGHQRRPMGALEPQHQYRDQTTHQTSDQTNGPAVSVDPWSAAEQSLTRCD